MFAGLDENAKAYQAQGVFRAINRMKRSLPNLKANWNRVAKVEQVIKAHDEKAAKGLIKTTGRTLARREIKRWEVTIRSQLAEGKVTAQDSVVDMAIVSVWHKTVKSWIVTQGNMADADSADVLAFTKQFVLCAVDHGLNASEPGKGGPSLLSAIAPSG